MRTLSAKGSAPLAAEHLRYQPRPASASQLHCILLDCSASMLRGNTLSQAKRLLLELCDSSYRHRSLLAVIGFAGEDAVLLQAPARAPAFNEDWIAAIRGGGGSPLSAALTLADTLLQRSQRQHPGLHSQLWIISDFRLRQLPPPPPTASACTLVDCEHSYPPLGRGSELASAWQANHVHAASLWSNGDR